MVGEVDEVLRHEVREQLQQRVQVVVLLLFGVAQRADPTEVVAAVRVDELVARSVHLQGISRRQVADLRPHEEAEEAQDELHEMLVAV